MFFTLALAISMGACTSNPSGKPTSRPPAEATSSVSPPATMVAATPTSLPPSPQPSATNTRTLAATPTSAGDPSRPKGYPLDPDAITDAVRGVKGARSIAARGGPTVREVSEQRQVSADPIDEDAYGWNCATHFEYEGMPAVDWYIQPGTPVRATMDGAATLLINTTVNAFDYYGVSREPYIGDPDRERAPLAPFPGPGGGMGVYVSVMNDVYRTDYGHLSLAETITNVPDAAFGAPYSRSYGYDAAFATPQPTSSAAIVATWDVRRGEVIGFTGDAGYSEAPHLHYQITRRSDGLKLCPTGEPQFIDGGWLLR